jgi:hypothetical protein
MGGKITDQQVRKLMEEMNKTQNKSFSAMKAGIDCDNPKLTTFWLCDNRNLTT